MCRPRDGRSGRPRRARTAVRAPARAPARQRRAAATPRPEREIPPPRDADRLPSRISGRGRRPLNPPPARFLNPAPARFLNPAPARFLNPAPNWSPNSSWKWTLNRSAAAPSVGPMNATSLRGAFLAALACVLVGASFTANSVLGDYPYAGGQALRYGLAALLLIPFLRRDPDSATARLRRLTRRQWGRIALLAAVGMVGFNLAVLTAEQTAEPAVPGVFVGCAPIVVGVLVPLLDGRRPSRVTLYAAGLVALGRSPSRAGVAPTWRGCCSRWARSRGRSASRSWPFRSCGRWARNSSPRRSAASRPSSRRCSGCCWTAARSCGPRRAARRRLCCGRPSSSP